MLDLMNLQSHHRFTRDDYFYNLPEDSILGSWKEFVLSFTLVLDGLTGHLLVKTNLVGDSRIIS